MRLGIQMLNSSSTVNSVLPVNQIQVNPGETSSVYFQLVDLDQKNGNCPASRYMPMTGATLSILLTSLNAANNLTKLPTNPFPQDTSVWSFNLSASDTAIMAGINMKATLTEGPNVRIANAEAVVIVGPKSQYSC
jgi:hypothetical protein